jgi:hypothetical protein
MVNYMDLKRRIEALERPKRGELQYDRKDPVHLAIVGRYLAWAIQHNAAEKAWAAFAPNFGTV